MKVRSKKTNIEINILAKTYVSYPELNQNSKYAISFLLRLIEPKRQVKYDVRTFAM